MLQLGLKARDLISLSYNLYNELASLAKQGGCIMELRKKENMCGANGWFYKKGYLDFDGREIHNNTIYLLEPIDVDLFYSFIPTELDGRKIPRDQIYRFVVYHEIGHALLDPLQKSIWHANGTLNEDKMRLLKGACELRADRYAWESLFPSQPLPKTEGCQFLVAKLEAFMIEHKNLFTAIRTPKPL